MKICRYLRRFHINTPFTFWDMRTWDVWKVYLQTFRNNRIRSKLAYFLRNLQTSRASNSRILRIKKVKSSGYCFYLNTNIYIYFQICISVPLTAFRCWLFSQKSSIIYISQGFEYASGWYTWCFTEFSPRGRKVFKVNSKCASSEFIDQK